MEEESVLKINASIVHRDEDGNIIEKRDVGTSTLTLKEFRERFTEKED